MSNNCVSCLGVDLEIIPVTTKNYVIIVYYVTFLSHVINSSFVFNYADTISKLKILKLM